MNKIDNYLNRIVLDDNLKILDKLPAKVDLIFADPPYNLQLKMNCIELTKLEWMEFLISEINLILLKLE